MRPGDVIVQVQDKPTASVSALLTAVASLKPGTPATFQLQRGDSQVELEVVPGTRPRPQRAPQPQR